MLMFTAEGWWMVNTLPKLLKQRFQTIPLFLYDMLSTSNINRKHCKNNELPKKGFGCLC